MRTRQRLETIHAHPDFPLVTRVMDRLIAAGHQTLVAGGGVRDALLGLTPRDLDLATAATPDQTQSLFERSVDVGRAFGTIVVVEEARSIEVTTFRRESEYEDGRHPREVIFTNVDEDASRRDFTVNALYYDPKNEELIDTVGGQNDLRAGCLRTVGDPGRRFNEDHLRMLRAVRFVAQLGFKLEPLTAAAIAAGAHQLVDVAAERTYHEMKRLLESPGRAAGLRAARATNVLALIWPECDLAHAAGEYVNWENAFAALSVNAGPARAVARLAAWRAPNEVRRRVTQQLKDLATLADHKTDRSARVRALGGKLGPEVRALARVFVPPARLAEDLDALASIMTADGKLPAPHLDGEELAKLGIPRDQRMGEILRRLYDLQLAGDLRSRDEAEALARLLKDE